MENNDIGGGSEAADVVAADGVSKDVTVFTQPEVVTPDEDRELAEKAYKEVSRIVSEHYETAIMEVGNYIKKNFTVTTSRVSEPINQPRRDR